MLRRVPFRRATIASLSLTLLMFGVACGRSEPPSETLTMAEPTATPLPPPRLSSPEAEASPLASPSPVALATPIPPPDLRPATPTTAPAAAAAQAGSERLQVANTEGQGANLRAEPTASAPLVRTLRDGTELEVVGPDRDADGRHWRNVRVPSDGVTGWIVSDFVAAVPGGAQAAAASPAAGPSAGAAPSPAASPAAVAPAPQREASPAAAGTSSGAPSIGAARPAQAIGDADRAYLGELQPQVDALGKAITAANEQIERAGGRPEILNDDNWRAATQDAADALTQAAAHIRAAKPGPATGEVGKYAVQAANYADEAATALKAALDSRDPRHLNTVRTSLVRVLAGINNMNLTLLQLQ